MNTVLDKIRKITYTVTVIRLTEAELTAWSIT